MDTSILTDILGALASMPTEPLITIVVLSSMVFTYLIVNVVIKALTQQEGDNE